MDKTFTLKFSKDGVDVFNLNLDKDILNGKTDAEVITMVVNELTAELERRVTYNTRVRV